ncbi:MAG: hypothetical protein M3070_01660 [Actinomycetota bacterium]|nr:hypothetical protein [Actinomycetota bacterium]
MTNYQPMPSGPPPGRAPARGAPPPTVVNAVRLMFVGAAISLIGLITEFALRNQIRDQIKKDNPSADSVRLDSLLNTATTIAVVVGAVFLVLYVLLALQVRKGKNWARIVTWVIAGLGVLGLLGTLAGSTPAFSRALGAIGGILDIVLIILLALKPSNDYFRKPRYEFPQYPQQYQ